MSHLSLRVIFRVFALNKVSKLRFDTAEENELILCEKCVKYNNILSCEGSKTVHIRIFSG